MIPSRQQRQRRIAKFITLLCGLSALPVGARAQLYAGAGVSSIHSMDRSGAAGVVGLAIVSPDAWRRVDLRLAASGADEGYGALSGGLAFTSATPRAVMPVVGVRGGLLWEPEYAGWMIEGSLGARASIGGLALRVEGVGGVHAGEAGPMMLWVGLELR